MVYLARIESYAKTSKTGDRSGLAEVPEDATVWPQVTSTRENCLGGDCPNYKHCFVMEARKQAMEADVVVVNHHLFFADVVLRDEGVAELLPACNTVIFDEAHQLPETASLFFGETVSTSQLIELARDTRIEAAAVARKTMRRCRKPPSHWKKRRATCACRSATTPARQTSRAGRGQPRTSRTRSMWR